MPVANLRLNCQLTADSWYHGHETRGLHQISVIRVYNNETSCVWSWKCMTKEQIVSPKCMTYNEDNLEMLKLPSQCFVYQRKATATVVIQIVLMSSVYVRNLTVGWCNCLSTNNMADCIIHTMLLVTSTVGTRKRVSVSWQQQRLSLNENTVLSSSAQQWKQVYIYKVTPGSYFLNWTDSLYVQSNC